MTREGLIWNTSSEAVQLQITCLDPHLTEFKAHWSIRAACKLIVVLYKDTVGVVRMVLNEELEGKRS